MIAYHNSPELKEQLIANMQRHIALDELKQGWYWKVFPNGERYGCSVACAAVDFLTEEENDEDVGPHRHFPALFGIPMNVAIIADDLFECCVTIKEMQEFSLGWISSIQPGADLSGVPNTYFIKKRNLPTTDRLKLFLHLLLTAPPAKEIVNP